MTSPEDDFSTSDYPYPRGPANVDHGLQVLLLVAGIATFSIILVVDGQVVTGTVIKREKWWELFFSELRQAGAKIIANGIEGAIQQSGSLILDDELEEDPAKYIHLVNAHTGDHGPMLMRVRLDQVAAWSLGNSPNGKKSVNEISS
ncbi:hypothetical protein ABZ214_08625 [Streptomyces iakyrus]|uniref:hypothetical protein n=1 Tax=Streptomyces iakyrus TaxID=68219 RepID=UPI00339F66B5